MQLSRAAMTKLQVLKELDEKIDFARSTLQLQIIMAFVAGRDEYTSDELSTVINERRKALIDALRKLENKGIIEKKVVNGKIIYTLTKQGKEYIERLLFLLGLNKEGVVPNIEYGEKFLPRKKDFTESIHVYHAIVVLANAEENMMSLRKLARLMGLSEDRARSYLDLYSRPPYRLFRRISHPTKGTYYKLEKEGFKIYYKSPDYLKSRKSFLHRIRLKFRTRISLPKEKFLFTLSITYSATMIILSILYGIPPLGLFSSLMLIILTILSLAL